MMGCRGEGVEDGVKVKERATAGLLPPQCTLRRLNATVGEQRAGTQGWFELLEQLGARDTWYRLA